MRFQLLGLIRVWRGGDPLPIGPAKQRSLVAALLLEPNRIVPLDRLVGMIWDGEPPASAVANVRTYASRLRRTLVDDTGEARLTGHVPGYRLAVGDDELDLTAFRQLAADGRAALAVGDPGRAAGLLGRAVGLWKGAAGEDLERSPGLDRCLGPLEEQRLVAVEDWIEAKQRLGDTIGLVTDLRHLLDEHPLRERLWAQLVLALYRTGDVAGALGAFGEARHCFSERLGVDLGPQLTGLHQAVLRRDPALEARPAAVSALVPRELPADTRLLVGRDREQATMAEAVLRSDGPVFIAVHGDAGIGKSALAVRVATRLGRHFPDGQLYVDLHGSDPGRAVRRPADVLAQCLRSLGVPGAQVPAAEEEAAARYRTVAANRRLLVVLEDAADEAQVRPLLTATAGSAVIITSRRRLAVHDRTVHIGLGPLTVADSVEVLAGLGGPGRDGPLLLRLARSCDGSPLALRRAATG
ncbi:BTAD domain-containing putative transcriptional regulator [Dactylosporangium sp. NPDC000244]|uniref:AfsR/SARP family transcriptional regulator n=1 Tax=Dactylosporangium sp. NPDC000244 TaxID=3154365 RepID=UPI00332E56A3